VGIPNAARRGEVVDEDMKSLPPARWARFIVRGEQLLAALGPAEATPRPSRGGWFHTRRPRPPGCRGVLLHVDRMKDMIITGGENVYLARVERSSTPTRPVRGGGDRSPDEKWGERVAAVITLRADATATTPRSSLCRDKLAGFKTPREVLFVDEIQNVSGKVLKRELRDRFAGPPTS